MLSGTEQERATNTLLFLPKLGQAEWPGREPHVRHICSTSVKHTEQATAPGACPIQTCGWRRGRGVGPSPHSACPVTPCLQSPGSMASPPKALHCRLQTKPCSHATHEPLTSPQCAATVEGQEPGSHPHSARMRWPTASHPSSTDCGWSAPFHPQPVITRQ